ncbi:hypothetical protein [Bradyrhizobium sp.]|uniref:hypothetical protein n=1 Tax=Bradyrhizobium sp. TaxID=376 RepID=UPI003C74F376
MVEKAIISPGNVIDLARYQHDRAFGGKTPAIAVLICRHCGAALLDGENEDECSSALAVEALQLGGVLRKSWAD